MPLPIEFRLIKTYLVVLIIIVYTSNGDLEGFGLHDGLKQSEHILNALGFFQRNQP